MNRENGSVLLISLVLLLILTVVGIASISGVSMTGKMTNNQKDYDTAFEMAEAALVQGERFIDGYDPGFDINHVQPDCNGNTCFSENCTNGLCFRGEFLATDSLCEIGIFDTPVWQTEAIWNANAAVYSEDVPGVEKPKYLIEFLCFAPKNAQDPPDSPPYNNSVRIYRITSLAYGANPQTRIMLQSTYRVE